MKLWVWIGGWGLPAEWQAEQYARCWPEFQHKVIPPTKLCVEELLCSAGSVERIGGYSLGAYLMLRNYLKLPGKPMFLLAPILDFKAEGALGGRVHRAQLAALVRWLKRDPLAALNDFYSQAGLGLRAIDELPYSSDEMIWGIQQLQGPAVEHWRLPNIQALIGERDILLNAAMMQALWPELTILPNAGHDLSELLTEAAA